MREPKTAEYQTFFRNQSKIANLISNSSGSIDRIAAVLYAKKIVGTAAIDAADNYGPDVNERVRVEAVLKEILESIKADKEKYYKMRSVLLSKDIVPGLAQCLPEGIGYIKINPGHILCLARVNIYDQWPLLQL